MQRGRVVALIDGAAVVRLQRGSVTVAGAPASWRVGMFVDVATREVIGGREHLPTNASEVTRLSPERVALLEARARGLATVRAFFAERGFLEVETPLIVPSPGLEIHLDAVAAGDGYLITSPEYAMKRLLAGGLEKIFQVCKCFRANERGPHHASEFTMIEWYRAFDTIESIARDTEALVHAVCGDAATIEGRAIDLRPPWRRVKVRDLMADWAGVIVRGDEPAAALIAEVRRAGIAIADELAWDDAFFTAWLARVEPRLAELPHAVLVEDWPAPLAALARRKDGEPLTALRFEAYVGGLELANAFDELTDPDEQEARFREEQEVRRARGRPVYPIDAKLLAALREGLPPSGGIALGFDRLVMLATGAPAIDRVQAIAGTER
ncbi:MAG TPA: EF-P lysine aminoacylase EpmA [Kofleriaceae bacterium]|nr:EF-P lysine aminoacylase EpmA [Kofleriaceae bacterium]